MSTDTHEPLAGGLASGDRCPVSPVQSPRRRVRGRYRRVAVGQAVSDGLVCVLALTAVHLWRGGGTPDAGELLVLLVAPVVWVLPFSSLGLYRPHRLSAPEEFRRIFVAAAVGVGLLTMLTFWSDALASRSAVATLLLVAVIGELVSRRLWRWQLWRLRRSGDLRYRTVVLGDDDDAVSLSQHLEAPDSEYEPIGFVSVDQAPPSQRPMPALGPLTYLRSIIHRESAECVFVASRTLKPDVLASLATMCRKDGVELRIMSHLPQLHTSRLALQSVGPAIAMSLQPCVPTRAQRTLKRSLDLVGAGVLVLATLPVMLAVAVLVRLSSPGPALYRQQRVTVGGRTFTMLKFRSMRVDQSQVVIDLTKPFFKLVEDPRVTPVGRVLRRLSLDELPQLLNVLKGDMSLVGPRPLPLAQVAANTQLLGPRHEVRAGLTGWWQVKGRSELTGPEAVRLDMFYIENWSLSLDLYILAKTAGAVLRRTGAV